MSTTNAMNIKSIVISSSELLRNAGVENEQKKMCTITDANKDDLTIILGVPAEIFQMVSDYCSVNLVRSQGVFKFQGIWWDIQTSVKKEAAPALFARGGKG